VKGTQLSLRKDSIKIKSTDPISKNPIYYDLNDLYEDQKNAACYILDLIKNHDKNNTQKTKMITLIGKAGSGKSVLVDTIITAMKLKYKNERTVSVLAPTGAAASNIEGNTIHNEWHIKANYKRNGTLDVSPKTRRLLLQENKHLKMIIIDERSMLNAELLAMLEHRVRISVSNGENSNRAWGNIPVVLLLGDDAQIPSIGRGALYCQDYKTSDPVESKGFDLFLEAAKNVIELDIIKRTDEKDTFTNKILEELRNEGCSEENGQYLSS
jgi:energy-coupling factor transporter ATP-binding protein EcfA2